MVDLKTGMLWIALSYMVTSNHTWLLKWGRSEIHIEFRKLSIEKRVKFFINNFTIDYIFSQYIGYFALNEI